MAYTQEQLDTLEAAIAGGELTVKYADRAVTYRSLDEMLRIRDALRRDLGLTPAAGGRVAPVFRKGLSGGC